MLMTFKQSDMMAKLCDVEQYSKAVHHWFLWNGLALNPDKMKVLLLGSTDKRCHMNCANAVKIAGTDISLVDSVKSLGGMIDSRLTFDKHDLSGFVFSYSCITACPGLYALVCVRRVLQLDLLWLNVAGGCQWRLSNSFNNKRKSASVSSSTMN